MKKTCFRFKIIHLIFIFLFTQTLYAVSNDELKSLYDKRQYFDLRDKLPLIENKQFIEINFYQGAVKNKFNQPNESINLLNRYLRAALKNKDEKLLKESYTLLADNFVKTYQYAKAAETYKKLLVEFSGKLDKAEQSNYENVARLWGTLSRISPQKISFKGNSDIQAVQEMVGLMVPLEVNKQKESFIFDTGANLSTVTESFAEKLNLKIFETQIDVTSITGNKIKAKLGIAEDLKLGNAFIKNVVFIVFPDAALYIAPIKYQIHGILGFPVIEALKEVTWTREKRILISANPGRKGEQNLSIDGLTPLIAGNFKGKRLTFTFDTGANTSVLYPQFFKSFEKEVKTAGTEYKEKVTGVGEMRELTAYLLENIEIQFAGKNAKFARIGVLTEKTTGSSEHFYGNIGRDLINQFEKMTLNFQTMNIRFE